MEAQELFNNGKYKKSKKKFQSIYDELISSDTDCMGDMGICGVSENYLEEINRKLKMNQFNNFIAYFLIFFFTIIGSIILYKFTMV